MGFRGPRQLAFAGVSAGSSCIRLWRDLPGEQFAPRFALGRDQTVAVPQRVRGVLLSFSEVFAGLQ